MIATRPSPPPPAVRLAAAIAVSLVAHLVAMGVLTRLDGQGTPPGAGTPRLDATLAAPAHPSPPIPPRPAPRMRPVAQTPSPTPALARPAEPAPDAAPPSPDVPTGIPADYLPIASLTREPELITEVRPDDWPLLPDAPVGTFRLDIGINASGGVDIVEPSCEPHLCAAAALYADVVRQWHFQPAELLGKQVACRITLEFELGDPPPDNGQAPDQ